MTVPKTLTDAANTQPATIHTVGVSQTSTNLRNIPYEDVYRGSTGVRETPAQRLQRISAAA